MHSIPRWNGAVSSVFTEVKIDVETWRSQQEPELCTVTGPCVLSFPHSVLHTAVVPQ